MKSALVILSLLASTSVFAKSLQGTFTLAKPCQVLNGRDNPVLPAGSIDVLENVETRDSFVGPDYAGILFQAGDEPESVLKLGIGRIQPFAYGGEASTVGMYASKTDFSEQYYSDTNAPQATIILQRRQTLLIIKSRDAKATSVCQLTLQP